MESKSDILERLASSMIEHNIQPEELIHEMVQVRKLPLTRRAALGLGLGAAALGIGAGSVLAGDTTSGQVSANTIQIETIEGPGSSTIVDLSANVADFSDKGFFVLPATSGASPVGIVAGGLWWDTSV